MTMKFAGLAKKENTVLGEGYYLVAAFSRVNKDGTEALLSMSVGEPGLKLFKSGPTPDMEEILAEVVKSMHENSMEAVSDALQSMQQAKADILSGAVSYDSVPDWRATHASGDLNSLYKPKAR